MSPPKLYIETSVVSYYVARPSTDAAISRHQDLTKEFWRRRLPDFDPYVSPVVLREAGKGDAGAAKLRLEAIVSFPQLELSSEIEQLAELYRTTGQMPKTAILDSFNVAFSSLN